MLYRNHPEARHVNGGLNKIRAIAKGNKNSRRYGRAAARHLASIRPR